MKNPKKSKKRPNFIILFSGFSTQLGVSMYIASKLGDYFDSYFETDKVLTAISLMLMLFLNLYVLMKAFKKFHSD